MQKANYPNKNIDMLKQLKAKFFSKKCTVQDKIAMSPSKDSSLLDKADFLDSPSFMAPLVSAMHIRSDSGETLVEDARADVDRPFVKGQSHTLNSLPTEILTLISMSSGFLGALNLRQLNRRFRDILSEKYSWTQFVNRSPDIILTQLTVETRLHHYDQILFATWPLNGAQDPCLVHRTFLEQFDFLGGMSLHVKPSGLVKCDFFEHRERLPCYIADVQERMSNGSIPPVIASQDSPIGGVRVAHSCPECKHYDQQQIVKSELVHQTLLKRDNLTHTFVIDSRRRLKVDVIDIVGVMGYSDNFPCVTTKIAELNGVELNPKQHSLYMKYLNVRL